MIIHMYASGVSTREIATIIEKLYRNSYTITTISSITNVALEEIKQWHFENYSILQIGLSDFTKKLDI